MTTTDLLKHAEAEITRLNLGDSETNSHGVVAIEHPSGVRLIDGVGLDEICTTREAVDRELEIMAKWYAESK